MEFWDTSKKYGRWRCVEQCDVFMKKLVRRALLDEFRKKTYSYKDFYVMFRG